MLSTCLLLTFYIEFNSIINLIKYYKDLICQAEFWGLNIFKIWFIPKFLSLFSCFQISYFNSE